MVKIDKSQAGWMAALTWLTAMEETARDFHGTRPKVFLERVYEHSVEHYLRLVGEEYGMRVEKTDSFKGAVEQYIEIGVATGLFPDASEFELEEVNPFRLNVCVHNCEYLRSCQSLIDDGFAIRDLTCARIGCFKAAIKSLASMDCDYQVRSFNIDRVCQGYIERV